MVFTHLPLYNRHCSSVTYWSIIVGFLSPSFLPEGNQVDFSDPKPVSISLRFFQLVDYQRLHRWPIAYTDTISVDELRVLPAV